jgi:hypothetical protein
MHHKVGDEVWVFDHGFLKKLPVLEVGSETSGSEIHYRLKSHASNSSWFMPSQVFETEGDAQLDLAASLRQRAAYLISEAERLEAIYGGN